MNFAPLNFIRECFHKFQNQLTFRNVAYNYIYHHHYIYKANTKEDIGTTLLHQRRLQVVAPPC